MASRSRVELGEERIFVIRGSNHLDQAVSTRLGPRCVVALCDRDASVAKQDRHVFHGDAVEQEFDREGVAEAMGAEILDARLHRDALQTIPPGLRGSYPLGPASPKVVRVVWSSDSAKRLQGDSWEIDHDDLSSLGSSEGHQRVGDGTLGEGCCILYGESRVSHQEEHRPLARQAVRS